MIATTISQSKHLLELGLDPKTADMCWVKDYTGQWVLITDTQINVRSRLEGMYEYSGFQWQEHIALVPAWSLSALLEVMCYCHDVDVEFRKDKNLGWICKWTFYDFDNKKRLDLSKCGETKIEAAFEIMVTLFVQGLIKKGDND